MAALQNSTLCLQKPAPFSTQASSFSSQQKLLNLSFSSTFPSLNLATTTATTRRSRGGGASSTKMMSATAAGSYASALAEVALANNTLEATASDVEKIEKVFSDPQVLDFFMNPTVEVAKKRDVIDEIAKSSELQPFTSNFLNVLLDAKRLDMVKDVMADFEKEYNKMTNTELAVVSSVVKLESQHLAQIAKQVQKLTGAKNVRIKTLLDPSLIAGFTVRYGNSGSKLIDMSVKKQLDEIAEQLDLGDIQLAGV